MRTEKRKARLDKGDSGDFLGFAAYAAASPPTASSNGVTNTTTTTTTSAAVTLRWSPVYVGSDSQLALLLTKIGQKRDGATKAKALQDLQQYLLLQGNDNDQSTTTTATVTTTTTTAPSKKDKVDALAHIVFLFHSKLVYDSMASVRAEVLTCLGLACQQLPKAWKTLTSQQPELWGMIYCAQADPAMEVRANAERIVLREYNTNNNNNNYLDDQTRGIWEYAMRILSYGRPKVMHDALFAKKKGKGDEMSETEKDLMEERFERIVGTVLSGLELWIQTHPTALPLSSSPAAATTEMSMLWKTLSSPKASLRRRTYSLLATCCRHVPSVVYGAQASFSQQILPQLFTAEKDAANFPSLFEMCLLYMAGAKKQPPPPPPPLATTDQPDASAASATSLLDPIVDPLVKHMSKVLKKACYGATASKWGPTLLPLLSLIPSEEHRLLLLTSTWRGLDQVVVVAASDKLAILTTVTECATFLLLQPTAATNSTTDDSTATTITTTYPKDVATVWLSALSAYLVNVTSNASQEAETTLLTSIARDIQKLDVACRRRANLEHNKVVHSVADWFWNEGLPTTLLAAAAGSGVRPLTRLLNAVSQQPNMTSTGVDDHWQSVLLALFTTVVSQYQGSSAAVPSLEAYALAEAILRSCHTYGCTLFDDDSSERSLGKFVMNDMLRWLVLHTSTVSLQRSERHAERCFHLLRMCLMSLSVAEQKPLLESFLRELITAKCDTELLAHGITILLQDISAEALLCAPLDEFLIRLGRELAEHGGHDHLVSEEDENDDDDEQAHQKAFTLLETVAAVGVGQGVLQAWIEAACPPRSVKESCLKELYANPLLETLVLLSRSGGSLSKDDATKVMLECWRRGQELWSGQCFRLLIEDEPLCETVITQASLELNAFLDAFCASENPWISHDVISATSVWSERAVRLLDLCADVRSTHRNLPVPSLKVIGLANVDFWNVSSSHSEDSTTSLVRFLCLMNALVAFEDVKERYHIVRDSSEHPNQLLVHLLFALSTTGSSGTHAESQHYSRCGQLLSVLGGSALGLPILEDLFQETVNRLVVELKSESSPVKQTAGGVAVLSQLVYLMLEASKPATNEYASDKLEASSIQVGDEVWYISSTEDEATRERATVVQVHKDDFPNLYFTISWNTGNNTKAERQTVADRLRRSDVPHDQQIPGEVQKLKDRVRERVSQQLVKPFVKVDSPSTKAAELINVLNSQTGWDKKVGLGSIQFEVLSLLRAMEQKLVSSFASPSENQDQIISLLNSLSLAMGFGSSTPSFPRSFDLLRLDPQASIREVDRYYSGDVKVENNELDRAVLRWLTVTVACDSVMDLRRSVIGHIFSVSNQIIGLDQGPGEFTDDCLLVLKAILSAMQSLGPVVDNGTSWLTETEIKCIQLLFSKFALGWSDEIAKNIYFSRDGLQRSGSLPRWNPYLSSLLSLLAENNNGLRVVGRGCCNDLVGALFDPAKQGIVMRMLDAVFTNAEPLFDDTEGTMGHEMQRKIETWKQNLADEDIEELDEDMQIVNSWVPRQLADEVSSWTEGIDAAEDEELAIGRMLCWLCLLRLTESAASKDVRNRLAFSSFFDKCATVTELLNLSLCYVGFRNDRKAKVTQVVKLEDIVQNKKPFEVSQLAELVLFRTVEVLPTMSKRWFEEKCPKQLTQSISDFVTIHVAPETFRRELGRIKSASVFGEMAVTGSLATRQVTATYAQDDFNLRVVVELPPCFPFRSAEVDCSKTLGIPEKRWRQWGLQIRLMLNSQDGTLQDALMLWKENVDKEFTGVEPCPVCYSVLSVKKHELPNTECKTCHNRFHSTCLKQWFLSSGKSQCVLCQQPWSGIRT